MKLNRLVLRNFGLFRGEQSIDLRPQRQDQHRPIILIGGHNGAGKTTLLEAIRVCLHGRLALGTRVSEVRYQRYLRQRLHRMIDLNTSANYASVGLEFEYSHLGTTALYFVQRAWEPYGSSGARERVRVLRDGKPLDDVDSELWSDFVRSLVPPGVAQLFFFDGEKIKRLAEEETESLALAESIKALLGLDLIERLKADLNVFSAKQVRRAAGQNVAQRLETLDQELTDLENKLRDIEESLLHLGEKYEELEVDISSAEERLTQSGAGLASRREQLRRKEASLTAEIAAAEKSARDMLDGVAPFLLGPRTAGRLIQQLKVEALLRDWEIGRRRAEEAVETILARLCNTQDQRLESDSDVSWVTQTIRDVGREMATPPENVRKVAVLHGLSDGDQQVCLQTLEIGIPAIAPQFPSRAKELVALEGKLRECLRHINRVPDADEFSPIMAEISTLQRKQAKLVLESSFLREQQATLNKQIHIRQRERNRLEKEEIASKKASVRLVLASQADEAADKYLKKLTQAKTIELETKALESFKRLSRKDNFVESFRINPDNFGVSLYDAFGDSIPKSSLSAGEKQIYAISLLWGMARVSGRPLPMIVDSPLGRLDSHHRSSLVSDYFPVASHQVILLSTDTEVDRTQYDELRHRTSHSYQLIDRQGWTEIKEGYFGEVSCVDALT